MGKIYYCTITLYDDYEEKNIPTTVLVIAENYTQAMSKIEKSFVCIEEITIEEIAGETECICIDDSILTRQMIKEYNGY